MSTPEYQEDQWVEILEPMTERTFSKADELALKATGAWDAVQEENRRLPAGTVGQVTDLEEAEDGVWVYRIWDPVTDKVNFLSEHKLRTAQPPQ